MLQHTWKKHFKNTKQPVVAVVVMDGDSILSWGSHSSRVAVKSACNDKARLATS